MGNLSNIFNKAVAFNKKIVKNIIKNKLPIATDTVTGVIMPDDKDFILSSGKLILNVANVTTPFYAISLPSIDVGNDIYAYIGKDCTIKISATSLLDPKNSIKEFQLYSIDSTYTRLDAIDNSASFTFTASQLGDYKISVAAVDIEGNKSLFRIINVYVRNPFVVKPVVTVPVTETMEKSLSTPFAISAFETSPEKITTLKNVKWTLYGEDNRTIWSNISNTTYVNGPKGSNISDMKASVYYELIKQNTDDIYLKDMTVYTSSSVYTPKKSADYTITCIGAGGNGGTGGSSNKSFNSGTYTVTSGGGAGGGGAGEVVTTSATLASDMVYQITIDSTTGNTYFGTNAVARGGSSGNNGGDATTTTAGIGGVGGSSYTLAGKQGYSGTVITGTDLSIVAPGGAGGSGGVTTDPDGYGCGGSGGTGAQGSTSKINTGMQGSLGAPGCVRIVGVSKTQLTDIGNCICFSPATNSFYIYNAATGFVYSSSEGTIWSYSKAITLPSDIITIGFGNTDYVVFASASRAVASMNGAVWSEFFSTTGDEKILNILNGCSNYSFVVQTSSRLILFSDTETSIQVPSIAKFVVCGNDKIVGVTSTSQLAVINDVVNSLEWGVAYTPELANRSGLIKDMKFFKNMFVMIDDRYIHYSQDLITWTTVDSTLTGLKKIVCTSSEIVFYSTDRMIAMKDLVNILISNKPDFVIDDIVMKNADIIIVKSDSAIHHFQMIQLSEKFGVEAEVTPEDDRVTPSVSDRKTYRYRLV